MKQVAILISFLTTTVVCLIGGFLYGFFKGNEYGQIAYKKSIAPEGVDLNEFFKKNNTGCDY